MVYKVKQSEIHTETITKSGECKVFINIQLDINVNNDGIVTIKPAKEVKDEPVNWAIPDFSKTPKIQFGKEG